VAKATQFIVIYDDDQGMACPMGWDADTDGAICCFDQAVAVFPTRADARKAIRISTAAAKLAQAQGKPVNTDFLGADLKKLRVVPLKGAK
jgi:hypothetical protein